MSVTNGLDRNFFWLLPPARTAYLAEARMRDSITFAGAHLWLDFHWSNSTTNIVNLCDVDFGVIKSSIVDSTTLKPDLSLIDAQWEVPGTPASLTSWDDDEEDGTDSFLWSHRMKGLTPPNAAVNVLNTGSTAGADHFSNQGNKIDQGTTDAPRFVCRTFSVRQEWQPDVIIRARRRLQKDEGILLFMQGESIPISLEVTLSGVFRVLGM